MSGLNHGETETQRKGRTGGKGSIRFETGLFVDADAATLAGMRFWRMVIGCWVFWALAADAADESPEDPTLLTVDRIFGKDEFKLQDWGPARWLKGGSGYTTLETSTAAGEAKDVVGWEPASGRREVLVSAKSLIPEGSEKPLSISDYAWTDDTKKLLIFTNTRRVWRRETRGDYWIFDRDRGDLRKLGGSAPEASMMFATFSPDGTRIAYVCRNDLYVQRLDNLSIVRLTRGGSASRIHGTSHWVNEEEFDLRHGFRWSPDSRHIAYWQFDVTGVSEYPLVNTTDSLYPVVTRFAYPKVGQTNSMCRVGVVRADGGRTRWFKVEGDPRNHYIPAMEWAPDSRRVVIQQFNRLQSTNRVFTGDIRTGATRELMMERDDAWVDVMEGWHWIDDGQRFLWLSERDGWRQLYSVSGEDGDLRRLTSGFLDVIQIAGVDETRGLVYFVASPDEPTRRLLYSAPLDGSGKVQRVTPLEGADGTYGYEMSDDGEWAIQTRSSFGRPPKLELIRLPDHKVVRELADNAVLGGKLAGLRPCSEEFFRVDIGGGTLLDGWCMKPADLDPAKHYPVLFHVYGEPAAATVVDRWGAQNYLWHRMLTQRGYVVISVDNRGVASPRGREWRKSIYRQIGILASADQANAVRQLLKDRPYLDPERVGVWGWSGGGSMSLNAIFRYPDLYRTAVAVAFISDQKLYDTIYQERYMGLPDGNPDGFRDGSPVNFAHQLKGELLLAYGTGDDNCHYQNCEVLINELVRHAKPFSLITYPNRTHAIREGEGTRRHLYETMTRFLDRGLLEVRRGAGNEDKAVPAPASADR